MPKDFLPSQESKLVTWSNTFGNLIQISPTDYGLVAAQATNYQTLNNSFVTLYNAANGDGTRTPAILISKGEAKAALKANARLLAGIIQKCPIVTNEQRSALGLTVHASPSPIPRPGVRPGMDLVSVNGRTVTAHIHDSASSSKRGKPAGATAAWVYSFVGTDYPSDPTEWNFEGSTTKAKFDIVFPNTVAGGTQVWVCAAWINGKQQSGPPSTPITTNLQGGGTSAGAAMKVAA